jgi:hypothetical protein
VSTENGAQLEDVEEGGRPPRREHHQALRVLAWPQRTPVPIIIAADA